MFSKKFRWLRTFDDDDLDEEAPDDVYDDYKDNDEQPNNKELTECSLPLPSKPRCRGVARGSMEFRQSSHSEPRVLEFDERGQHTGDFADKYATDVGVQVRTHININYKRWKQVPQEIKDLIWDNLKRRYTLDDDKKHYVLKHSAKLFKDWKCKLTSGWIRKSRDDYKSNVGKEPYKIWPTSITREDWEKFKAERETPEFQAISESQRKRQKMNMYPHHLGRHGYRGKIQQWESEKAYEVLFPNAPLPTTPESADTVDRSLNWMLARAKKDKNGRYYFPAEPAREAKQKMDELCEKAMQGEWTPTAENDLLTETLGKHDSRGRVLGYAGTVGIKQLPGKRGRRRLGWLSPEEARANRKRIAELEQKNKESEQKNKEWESLFEEKLKSAVLQILSRMSEEPSDDAETTQAAKDSETRIHVEVPEQAVVASTERPPTPLPPSPPVKEKKRGRKKKDVNIKAVPVPYEGRRTRRKIY